MERKYDDLMAIYGYDTFVSQLFPEWENVKDELLPKVIKEGSGNGTIHVFLGQENQETLQSLFPLYYEQVYSKGDVDNNCPKIRHFFLVDNLLSIVGFTYEYYFRHKLNDDFNDFMDNYQGLFTKSDNNKILQTESLFKLSLGGKYRPYFKQFDSNGDFSKIVRPLLIPTSAYKISLYKNKENQVAALWSIGFKNDDDYNIRLTDLKSKQKPTSLTSEITWLQYITAIRTKPFVLLAGISGTGKSRIVRELARACWPIDSKQRQAQKPSNYEIIQVKPNWHDSSELFGYVSRITGKPKYIPGKFIKFIAKAWENENVPHFLCLDEMNLAPVEQYFAEYLSVIETRKLNGDKIITDPLLSADDDSKDDPQGWYHTLVSDITTDENVREKFLKDGITIPQNLVVMGTVNMDETTFTFSRKVLDRAMTIEMNEVYLRGGLKKSEGENIILETTQVIGDAAEGSDIYDDNSTECDIVLNYLEDINSKLENTPFKIAYRARNEFLMYAINRLILSDNDDTEFVLKAAMDEMTSMKILSRIEGDEQKVTKNLFTELSEVIMKHITGEDESAQGKSVSLIKIKEMKKKLENTGFTSFWS